jgi:hypothetical protein
MGNNKIDEILADMSSDAKKEILDSLVSQILSNLSDTDKKEMLQKVMIGQKENRHLSAMVEH